MFSVLITSTMKSEPLRASVSGVASGSTFSLGGTGGTLDPRGAGVCAAALFVAAARPSAGPTATAPARNWRRFILGDLDKAASLAFGRNLPFRAHKTKPAVVLIRSTRIRSEPNGTQEPNKKARVSPCGPFEFSATRSVLQQGNVL